MNIQSISNTNFGKIGKLGGKSMGRGVTGRKLQPNYRKAEKNYQDFKAQVRHSYNSNGFSSDMNELCEDFMSKAIELKNKFVKIS